MKCLKELCGAEIPNGARFCTECKTEVQTTVSNKTRLCPSCNNIVLENYKFCSCCAWKVDPDLFIDRVCSGTKDDGQKCKTVLTSCTKFCPYCGTPQETPYTLTGPVDKAGPIWVNQKTGEPQDSEQAGLVDEKFPDLKYQQRVTTEGSGLPIPIAKEDPDCIDRQISLEPKGGRSFKIKCSKELCGAEIPNGARCCTECKTEVQTTVSDKTILCPSCNKIVLEKYKFCSCCRWKVDPDLFIDRECSGTKDDGQKCKTMLQSSTKVSPYCGTPQDTPYTLKIKDEPLEPSSQITRESTIMNIKKECTQTRTEEPGDIPSSSNVHVCQMKRTHGPEFALADTCSKRRKDMIGDPSNEEVILISDSESDEDKKNRPDVQDVQEVSTFNPLKRTNERKEEEEEEESKKFKEGPDSDKEFQHVNTLAEKKYGTHGTGEQEKRVDNIEQYGKNNEEQRKPAKDTHGQDCSNEPQEEYRTIYSRTDLSHFKVHFHAIMHASIFDDRCRVFVRFASDNLGGWQSGTNELYPNRKFEDGNCEVEGQVDLPRGFKDKQIAYKYFIACGNKEQQEFVYNQKDNLRFLYVTSKQLKSLNDVFHQYDGVIRGYKGGITNFLKNLVGIEAYRYKEKLTEDAKQSAISFLPQWPTDSGSTCGLTGDDMIMRISILYRGLSFSYCKNTKAIAEKDLKNLFTKAIKSGLDAVWHEFTSFALMDFNFEARRKIFMNAVTVAYLVHDYTLVLSSDELSTLSEALLPGLEMSGQSTCIDNMEAVFSQTFHNIPDVLMYVAKRNLKAFNASWLCSMPLIHFLSKQCYPGEKPSEDTKHDHHRPYWWGIPDRDHNYEIDSEKESFKKEIESFKRKIVDSDVLQDMVGRLKPYFEMDYLLPRVLMASLKLEQLPVVAKTGYISTDIILASLCFYVKTEKDISKNSLKETAIKECLTVVKNKFSEESYEKSVEFLKCAWRSFMIAADVLTSMKDRGNKLTDTVIGLALDAFLISLHVFTLDNSNKEFIDKTACMGSYETTFDAVKGDIRSVLNEQMKWSKEKELLACLKSWDRMMNVSVPPGLIRDQFTMFIKESLHKSMKDKILDEKLVKVYCQSQNIFCDAMVEVLATFVSDAVVKCSSNTLHISKWSEEQLSKYGRLLSVVFERHIYINQDIFKDLTSILQFRLETWKPFPIYVKMCNNYASNLSESCLSSMKEFQTFIECVIQRIFDRTITMEHLHIIEENQEYFFKILKDILPVIDTKVLKNTMKLRIADMNEFKDCMENLRCFIDICHHSEVNTLDLEEQRKRLNGKEVKLTEICAEVDVPKDIKKYRPRIIAFKLNAEILEALPEIIHRSNGKLFQRVWDNTAEDVRKSLNRALRIDDIMEHVWKPAYKEWKALHQRLKTGEIFFREFDRLCGHIDLEILPKEFLILEDGKKSDWIKERVEQITSYKNLQNCLDGASIIKRVVKEFELKGDFQPVKQIWKMTEGKNMKMNSLNKSYLETFAVLSDVDERKINCLLKFVESKNLVNWLKKKMKNLKELKFFVNLAYISTGDKGLEIAKVRCLNSAAIGYAPLIFNLKSNCDYKLFLKRCEKVWNVLLKNPNLPTELLDTCRELKWLKIVDKSQGNVQITSLAQAEAINLNGTYYIGSHKTGDAVQRNGQHQLQLSDALKLRVIDKDGKLEQEYNYEQLHDLQSRLMLVAGKAEMGKDDVDRFILILDSVVRLCNVYIKLLSSGCVLFLKFTVKFRCDPQSVTCAFVSFGEREKSTIIGKIDAVNKDVCFFIPKIAKFLEQCHEKWLEFIDRKREDYYILNYFNIEQMVILQHELVKMGFECEPSDLIYPLLSIIKHDCTREDLVNAMKEAKDELKQMDKVEEEGVPEEEEVQEEDDSKAAERKFVLEMVNYGFSEDLARKALKYVTPNQILKGIAWCAKHEEDMETSPTDGTPEQNQEQTFSGWITGDLPSATVAARLWQDISNGASQGLPSSVDTLIENLEKLWGKFVGSISSSVKDYLSVEHLALILRKLVPDKETMSVERSFLEGGCKEGIANLIVCSQSEIYNTVLSLYGTEDDSPLPLSDEVLLCTPNTSLDMLEIFWRRSLFGDSDKIYCLVNGDLLDYEVSDKGEKLLEKHMRNAQSREIQFKLVVVCSKENEYKSRMVAALDQYRRPQMSFDGERRAKTYLSKRYIVDKPNAASCVDFDRSSVRVVKSWRAGVGKSLFKRNMVTALKEKLNVNEKKHVVSIPLCDRTLVVDEVLEVLLEHTNPPHVREPRIFHFDISHEVQDGVDAFLFQLLVLGCLSHTSGNVWRRSDMDYYIIESMPLLARDSDTDKQVGKLKSMHRCLEILPDVLCRSPKESLDIFAQHFPHDFSVTDLLFDENEYASETFQTPYQYLRCYDRKEDFTDIDPQRTEGYKEDCLKILLRHCGVKDPSWSELYHFVSFLNYQLQDFKTSAFCKPSLEDILPGFPLFVLKFMIQMSRDFATRSLQISEESPIDMLKHQLLDDVENNEGLFVMRKKWESSPHPYLFFHTDHDSMTFLGFIIDKKTGNLIDEQTGKSLEDGIMEPTLTEDQPTLYHGLIRQSVNLSKKFDSLLRSEKIEQLCKVMGINPPHDPDETYELTTDNVKKILAIYMRFRCDIPVIIMGETGCGKTRLIKFMCSLQHMPGKPVRNMIIMKVHGGTTAKDIIMKVEIAEKIATKNAKDNPNMFTVLFFDEANTTEAIGVIKEIMCDKSLGGKPIEFNKTLKIIAACNPYRKHKEELIKKLEMAGLGYHVDADKTTDRLGRVPMRRLVYRVQPLPQSMLPLVWDFGQLNAEVEKMYIKQMVNRYVNKGRLPEVKDLVNVTSNILSECQNFMRKQEDESSFVSLRDVERVLEVMTWFYRQTEKGGILYDENADHDEDNEKVKITRTMILALGVCYQACLHKRQDFRDMIAGHFVKPYKLLDKDQLETELTRCQDKFLDSMKLEDNIARNQALKENVFMMIVCIELRIPLFLVGKPGSSKSLAKTIVEDAMQGDNETVHSELFEKFKQVQMVSFQCSPLSTPDGILGIFKQCAEIQKKQELDKFVSVVVLDEIGLAEDSPRMPLKTLHPLLEDGCSEDGDIKEPELNKTEEGQENGKPDDPIYKKVAFIGISNWALDPAKMNRGIFVQREVPDKGELINSARGICTTLKEKKRILNLIDNLIPSLSKAYSELFLELEKSKQREFFGLRDFYSLIKMVYAFAARTDHKPTWLQLQHAIMRNFGGLENINPVDIFRRCLMDTTVDMNQRRQEGDPDCSSGGMIKACLEGDSTLTGETRYLLLLTENYGDLAILQQKIQMMHNAQVIFGSSFPSDQEYTQVCRNINRIKVCMETGTTVILLNLENLYESLYDALNQYYMHYGGERYVDLGLGSHRVKCRVHKEFRLIVVAEKEIVYKKFPIPLINRLEKHVLSISTMLSKQQLMLANKLEDWVKDFCDEEVPLHLRKIKEKRHIQFGEVFMGYHADTCAAIIMQLFEDRKCPNDDIKQNTCKEILDDAKTTLLWCAAPDAVLRLHSTNLRDSKEKMMKTYFEDQQHDSLRQYLHYQVKDKIKANLFTQVTTHSKLLSTPDLEIFCRFLPIQRQNMTLLTLQSFDTEQQFCRQIRFSLEKNMTSETLLIVQCDCGDQNADLVACARYSIQGELQQITEKHSGNIHVVLIIQLPRVVGSNFTGFQCGLWNSVHIDDLRPLPDKMPSFIEMYHKPVSAFFDVHNAKAQIEDMEKKDENQDMDVEPQTEKLLREEHIDILSLIMNCVHSALSQLKDPEKDSQRTTERIKMVFGLIQGSLPQPNAFPMQLKGARKRKGTLKMDTAPSKKVKQGTGNASMFLATPNSTADNLLYSREPVQRVLNTETSRDSLEHSLEGKTFLNGIAVHSHVLQREQEDQESEIDKNWLSKEASKPDHINSAGTFRRAAILYLEEKIACLLASIIAFIDKNCNMNIIMNKHAHHWQRFVWLEILNCPQVTQLHYTHQIMKEHVVQGTSYKGGGFLAEIPFSWLIYKEINEFMKTTFEEPRSHEDHGIFELVMRTANRLESTPLGNILSQIEGTNIQEVIHSYIKDFVHMAYPVRSEPELLIICENIMVGCRQIIQGEVGRLYPALVGCHAAFHYHRARFSNFSDIVHVWPVCCEKVTKFQEHADEEMRKLQTADEITVDLMGLHLLMKNLVPSLPKIFNTPSSRKQWIGVLCDFRPVVERIFGFFKENEQGHDFSPRCTQAILTARYLWTRATVLKLFIEDVCTDYSEVERCIILWAMLEKKSDMKTIESFNAVENFLKKCNKDVISKLFGKQKCNHCKEPYSGANKTQPSPPVTLPCHHTICRRCFNETITSPDVKCPSCDKPFLKDFQPVEAHQSESVIAYQDFRRRCNSFFMLVVSQLCFAEGTAPSNDIVNKLLSYITVQRKKGQVVTKQLTIFDDCIDSTPVVRSFLLQHLMRTSGSDVHQHLENYFRGALKCVSGQSFSVCHLVLQCMEDSCHQRYPEENKELIQAVTEMLRNSCKKIQSSVDAYQLFENMEHLAQTRFSLGVAANLMHKAFIEETVKLDTRLKQLFEAVGKLCETCGSNWPRRYLIKYLCRCYGTDCYQKICTHRDMTKESWINLPELQNKKNVECHDRFIVCGEGYTQMREAFVKAALNEDVEKITNLLQEDKWETELKLQLVVYREFTMNFLYEEADQQFSQKVKQFLNTTLMNCNKIQDKELIKDLLENSVWKNEHANRNISLALDLGQQGLSCLLLHSLVLLKGIPGKQTLLSPLINIAKNPELMMESYFPTMPLNDLEMIKKAMQTEGENFTFYRCANGHLYGIGNCGQPVEEFPCSIENCTQMIGGKNYKLTNGNIKNQQFDTSDTGHILGRANNRSLDPFPERCLKPANSAIMKLLLHLAMYVGANYNAQAIRSAIKPDIEKDNVLEFLLGHIEKDLKSISSVLGKSVEDVLVLIHFLLEESVNSKTQARIEYESPEDDLCLLKKKESRETWEENFNKRFIAPVLEKSEEILNTVNNKIINDKRLGSDPLLQLLFETDKPAEIMGNNYLSENPSVWQFRDRISIKHLMQTFRKSQQNCPVLQEFLHYEHFLRSLRFVPGILRLQKMLIQKYSRRLERAEALELTMNKVLIEFQDSRSSEIQSCWNDFKQAWKNTKQYLKGYGFSLNGDTLQLSEENYDRIMDETTPIAYVLTSEKDTGLCSYALLFFLLKKQNEFLEKYCQQSEPNFSSESLPKVSVKDISAAHLISYHQDRDLLPMVLANCNYSFEVGQGTKVEYNFTDIERQLKDRFLFKKSIVKLKEIDTIVYKSETTNAEVFIQLRDRIKQERLSAPILSQIQVDLKQNTFPELCDHMDKLDIAISFLKSVGSDPESPLSNFMVNILQIDSSFISRKVQQSCKCKHVQCLWMTLALEKTKRLENNNKESFGYISLVFKQKLSEGQSDALNKLLNNLQIEQLDYLSQMTFDCLLLTIDMPQKDMSKDSFENAVICMHLMDPPYANQAPAPVWLERFLEALSKDKDSQLDCSYAVDTWVLIHEILTDKKNKMLYR